jgi:hypothetical protein
MPKTHLPGQLSLDDLTAAVRRLSPGELRRFTLWLAEWKDQNGGPVEDETALIQMTKARLPPADERRLKRLSAKSERGKLNREEMQEYRTLARQAEQLDGKRAAALAELVRRSAKPLAVVMKEIGWKGEAGGT